MNSAMTLPLLLGVIAILQGALNKSISSTIGLMWMLFIGNIVTLLVCIAFYFVVKANPQHFSEFIRFKDFHLKWWYIIPGVMGFILVSCLPISFYKVGAVKTTVGLIAAQMVTSVAWDILVEGISLNATKGLGIIFAFLSVIMITLF